MLGVLLLLAVLSPLLISIGLLVLIGDGWPVLYLRRVLGSDGEFNALKFRTMCRNADTILRDAPLLQRQFTLNFKLKSDPRVTQLGAWLRKYSLDELPQLINVLRGQMSLVGPRMITGQELCRYGEYRHLLKSVKPGLTGYWQVRGRQDVSYAERVRMDVYYIEHWTLSLDICILLETPWRVVRGRGAY